MSKWLSGRYGDISYRSKISPDEVIERGYVAKFTRYDKGTPVIYFHKSKRVLNELISLIEEEEMIKEEEVELLWSEINTYIEENDIWAFDIYEQPGIAIAKLYEEEFKEGTLYFIKHSYQYDKEHWTSIEGYIIAKEVYHGRYMY